MRWIIALLLMFAGCQNAKAIKELITEGRLVPPSTRQCDQVQSLCIPHNQGFRVSGNKILKGDQEVELRGVNWFGLETTTYGLHGLWSGRTLESFVDQIKELGFNAIRVPIAPEALSYSTRGSDGFISSRHQLERLIEYSEQQGVYILLDLHKCSAYQSHMDKPAPGMGSCAQYTEDEWQADLGEMAAMARNYQNVVGIDIFNEPYGPTWERWSVMATEAGNAVLAANPYILVFVEGVGGASPYGGFHPFWGENLTQAGDYPVKIPTSRLVYSPHAYGPSVAGQSYFDDGRFPQNMPGIWDTHFGYLMEDHPLAVGEFGGRYQGKDQVWQDAFVAYIKREGIKSWFYWSLNPNSGDTGGILLDDWRTVDQRKMALLQRLM